MSLAISATKFSSSAASGGYFSLKGRQTQIMICMGSGIALKGKGNHGKNGVIGKYGAFSNSAMGLIFPKRGYISSPPIVTIGIKGDPVSIAALTKPAWNSTNLYRSLNNLPVPFSASG